MNVSASAAAIDYATRDDADLVQLALHGHRDAFRQIMQRCNQRLFRVARGLVNEDAEAEDVVQEAYLHAFDKLATFRGEASLLTWLTRIVINEARGRLRDERRTVDLDHLDKAAFDDGRVVALRPRFGEEDPAAGAARAQIRGLIEQAIGELPASFRVVFVMRDIEQCTVEETAANLDIRPETVKTRLHRARRLLRTALEGTLSATLSEAFPFLGPRCLRMTESVLDRVA
ncbi:MAG: RNA polymerase sigma factor, partial [Lysobacterales bacterium]